MSYSPGRGAIGIMKQRESLLLLGLGVGLGLGLGPMGCASMNTSGVGAEMTDSMADGCFAGALRAEPGVLNFRELPRGDARAYGFEIEFPHAEAEHAPAFVALQELTHRGWRARIDASFRALGRRAKSLRQQVNQRQQEMLARVVMRCTGRAVRFDPPRECGKGEDHTLCASGQGVP